MDFEPLISGKLFTFRLKERQHLHDFNVSKTVNNAVLDVVNNSSHEDWAFFVLLSLSLLNLI